jgi:hypothetical protein
MAYTNFSKTVDAIDPCDQARGTNLLQHLSDIILPVDAGSKVSLGLLETERHHAALAWARLI